MANPISATIDFDRDGLQHGFLQIPHSRNDSAWGSIMLPITMARNGQGPGAILTGANHGDEYEGPIALQHLANHIDVDKVSGRVIIIPAMNYPAFQAATRVSPIDQLNMNRIFPGSESGTVTRLIADYITRVLLPMCDYVLDIHSGGKTLEFLPFAAYHELEDKTQQQACEAATHAFAAPYYLSLLEIDAGGMYDTQAEAMGKIFVSTELGGGGTSTARTVEIARRGAHNFLVHAGILDAPPLRSADGSVKLDMQQDDAYVFSRHNGLLEPCVSLGDAVQKGDLIARVYATERTGQKPIEYHAASDGIILGRHFPSLIKIGDFMNVIARIVQE
ncbi:MAG: N(2)-acetyl-L-2,4-diaminobutanoate deacetylase DoeB [Gammaproteobacteria bacterium]|nr:N(2)-acetyl-L-2,4-diaminobutanoate deacetylase DoeB [Gammaproteobacteria bacterium]MDH3536252.1 N(2)-acetyl-L-2,4-diaminobutanoate deacetylase DoeB [Gammaproteobacteria bacterium]